MPVLLSGTIAAAISSATAPQSGDLSAVTTAASAIAELKPATEPAPPDYVIVDIPEFNREAGPLPAVVDEASAPVGNEAAPADGTFDQAVVAAHDARIELIRQRIAQAQTELGDEVLLRDLQRRLTKAQAARERAAERVAQRDPDQPPVALASAPAAPELVPPAQVAPPRRAVERLAARAAPAEEHAAAKNTDLLQHARVQLATARQALDERRQVAGPLAPVQQATAAGNSDVTDWLSPESAARIGVALTSLLAIAALARGTRLPMPA